MDSDQVLRERLVTLLQGKGAHMTFEQAVAGFPSQHVNTRPPKVPYTFWHLLEHLRITQWDILEYICDPDHVSPNWPEGYWPEQTAQTDAAGWEQSIGRFLSDRQALQDMVSDPDTDLFTPFPHGHGGHNILREVLIISDHNAYHVGELAILRQVVDIW